MSGADPSSRYLGSRLRMKVALICAVALVVGLGVPGSAFAGKPSSGGGGGGGGGTKTPPANVAFTPPLPLPGGGAEPSIRNAPDATYAAYISAPTGVGSNFWFVNEIKNADGSLSFKPNLRSFDEGTGGGDSDIAVGNKVDPTTGCDPLVFSGLHNIDLLVNFTTSYSTDCGRGWASPNLFAVQNVGDDRQWMTFDGSKTVFLIFHKVDTSQIVVTQSLDGGATYTSFDPSGATGIIDAATMPSVFNTNQIGNITVDYTQPTGGTYPNGEPIHALYAIFAGPKDAADNAAAQTDYNTGYNHNDAMYVAKSTDGGHTWVDTQIFSVDPSTHRELNMLFPVVAVDSAGTVYAAWSDGYKVQYSFSKDHGATWSKAYQVNPDNRGATPDAGHADVFPWIAAGSTGKLDVVWYQGSGGDTSGYRDPGTAANADTGDPGTNWTVAFAQLFNANVADATGNPTPKVTVLDQDVSGVIHNGDICQNGLNCDPAGVGIPPGNRTLLDFFEVSVDKLGRANIAYASDYDASSGASTGTATVMYARQNGGLSAATGKAVTVQNVVPLAVNNGTSCPGPQVLDPTGDAYASLQIGADPLGGSLDTFDITAVRFTTPDASNLQVALTLNNLSAIPATGTAASLWRVFWTYNGTVYVVRATSNGPGLQYYDVATYDPAADGYTAIGTVPGTFAEGPNGTITWTVPRSAVGLPATGTATITSTSADDTGAFQADGQGLRYVGYVDRGPDTNYGANYVVGGSC
jgi:hypothetical protein